MRSTQINVYIFLYVSTFLLNSCGYKSDPEPLFTTPPSTIDKELIRRSSFDDSKSSKTVPLQEEKKRP